VPRRLPLRRRIVGGAPRGRRKKGAGAAGSDGAWGTKTDNDSSGGGGGECNSRGPRGALQ